jgi:hypothetical protein
MKRILLQVLFLSLLTAGVSVLIAGEKVGTTSFQFLKLSLDARSAAMGDAAVSSVNSSEALFWNPAGLRRTTGLDISTSYVNYFLDVKLFSGTASLPIGGSYTMGVFAAVVDYGKVEVTDAAHLNFDANWNYNPGFTGEVIHPTASVVGVSLASSVTDKLSFGVSAKYFREDLAIAQASAVAFDGGLLYQTGWRSVCFAASIKNFGPEVTYVKESYPIPETFAVGISAFVFAPADALLFQTGSQSLLVSYDLSHPRDYDQQHHIGVEWNFMEYIYLRGGYKINFDEEGLTYGVGLKYSTLRMDYAYDKFGNILPSVHRFTIGYALN